MTESQLKESINRFLRFMKSEKANLAYTPGVKLWINDLDKDIASILLDKNIPIEDRPQQARKRLARQEKRKLKAIYSNADKEGFHKQTLKHLKVMIRRMDNIVGFAREYKYGKNRCIPRKQVTEKQEFNTNCKFYPDYGNATGNCLCGMDMTFCGKYCGYATTLPVGIRHKAYDVPTVIHGGTQGTQAFHSKKKSYATSIPNRQVKDKERMWKNYYKEKYYNEMEGRMT